MVFNASVWVKISKVTWAALNATMLAVYVPPRQRWLCAPPVIALETKGPPIHKADVYGNTARFFFRQPIGVNACKRTHKHCLAVVHMARRSDDHAMPGH